MNPRLASLHPYPFERLRELTRDIVPSPAHRPISLSIGEPKHATPRFIKEALSNALDGLATYPATAGEPALREACAAWALRRYGARLDPATQVLPVNGSREALFAIAQVVVDASRPDATVVCPNPFYQIYEGAALLAGATTAYANSDPARNFACDWSRIDAATWARTQLLYVCSPGNPTGAVMPLDEWRKLFALSDRFGFAIASDECYSEIYFRDEPPLGEWQKLFELSDRHGFVIASDECYSEIYFRDDGGPPLGGLQAARALGRDDFRNLIMLTSLSKRSNVPGMRSGFVAGDARIIKDFLLYRTYHGSAMSPLVQAASLAAWRDEEHVVANRALYREKFARVTPLLQEVLDVRLPDAGFYLWAGVPARADAAGDDIAFACGLLAQYNVTVLPGSLLAREAHGTNPGRGRIRMALVAETAECLEAAERIVTYTKTLS
jgi:N-succinyldiaminopimelate aminotransferase